MLDRLAAHSVLTTVYLMIQQVIMEEFFRKPQRAKFRGCSINFGHQLRRETMLEPRHISEVFDSFLDLIKSPLIVFRVIANMKREIPLVVMPLAWH